MTSSAIFFVTVTFFTPAAVRLEIFVELWACLSSFCLCERGAELLEREAVALRGLVEACDRRFLIPKGRLDLGDRGFRFVQIAGIDALVSETTSVRPRRPTRRAVPA